MFRICVREWTRPHSLAPETCASKSLGVLPEGHAFSTSNHEVVFLSRVCVNKERAPPKARRGFDGEFSKHGLFFVAQEGRVEGFQRS